MTSDRLTRGIVITAAVVVIIFGLEWSAPILAPILFAFTLTLLIWPVLKWFSAKGFSRALAITALAFLAVFIVGALITIVAISLRELAANLPTYTERLNAVLEPILNRLSQYGYGTSAFKSFDLHNSNLAQAALSYGSRFIGNIYGVIMFLLTLFLMILASDGIVKRYNEIATEDHTFIGHFTVWSKYVQTQYRVQTISNLISGVVSTVIFLFFGIDFAVLWGVLAFLLAYVPNFGIIIASIPPVFLAFIMNGPLAALIVITLITLLNLIMDNIVTPRLMGAEFEVPSIAVFLSFIIFTYIFGILGAFLALPLLLAIRQVLASHPETKFIALLLGAKK